MIPAGVQGLDRYVYANNSPINYADPTGHDAIPYDQLIQQAIDFYKQFGYQVIGNPFVKSIYTNGADLVFKAKEGSGVLAVEIKNVSGNVNLGILGKNAIGVYGGGLDQIVKSAGRFFYSSNKQLSDESQAVIDAFKSGNLQNALFTTASNVSEKAQEQFNGVFSNVKNGAADVLKGLPAVATTGLNAVGTFLSSCETFFIPFFFYVPPPTFFGGNGVTG